MRLQRCPNTPRTLAEEDEVVNEVYDLLARLVEDGGDREARLRDAP